MNRRDRIDQHAIRARKAEADRAIWRKVPPLVITREEAAMCRRATPRRVVVK